MTAEKVIEKEQKVVEEKVQVIPLSKVTLRCPIIKIEKEPTISPQ
jgi:hypothetical protein